MVWLDEGTLFACRLKFIAQLAYALLKMSFMLENIEEELMAIVLCRRFFASYYFKDY